jgi:hypothetical protein
MKTKTFFKEFVYPFPQNKATTLNQISHLYINKALRTFFNNHNIYKLKENQLFGIILKLKFENDNIKDDDSIRSMSTMIRADKTSFIKLTTLFKHLLALRMNDYKDMKANQIIFSFHIFSEDYKDTKLSDEIKKEIITNKQIIETDLKTKIDFLVHRDGIKLPLLFANNANFVLHLTKLNPDIVGFNDDSYKYKIIFNQINNIEVEVKLVLQSDNSIIIQNFIDKLISIPKLNNKTDILIERSFKDEIYLIDSINNELILYKNNNANKSKGFIKSLKIDASLNKEELNKFITFDFETIKVRKSNHSFENIPVLLGYYDHYNNISDHLFLFDNVKDKNLNVISHRKIFIQHFLEQFLTPKYNGFKFYAHNLSRFESLCFLYLTR